MHIQQHNDAMGYIPTGIEDMIRDAAAASFAKEYGWFMLQYAVYDERAARYTLTLGA